MSAAETNSIENSIGTMVIAQGRQVMSDLTVQLQQSITEEVNNFNVDFSFDESVTESLAWLSEEEATHTDDDVQEREHPEAN